MPGRFLIYSSLQGNNIYCLWGVTNLLAIEELMTKNSNKMKSIDRVKWLSSLYVRCYTHLKKKTYQLHKPNPHEAINFSKVEAQELPLLYIVHCTDPHIQCTMDDDWRVMYAFHECHRILMYVLDRFICVFILMYVLFQCI